ncbi:hypothetical protein [Nonomuraea typhae]|uniref:Contractile injection system tube protein N-terminal domain-containing protein n=1 Tax=Nonomuraea typhae TaxID=2603600 RepID=A0ABW7YJR9_9ACTN
MPEPKNTNVNLPGAGNWNLPFDTRLTTYGDIGTVDSRGRGNVDRTVRVQRGFVRTDPQGLDANGKKPELRYLYFLYNPATISTGYGTQWDAPTTALAMRNDAGEATPLTQLQQTIDFSLLFDRTYEVMDGSPEGAWRDVRAALAMTGVMSNVDASAVYTTGSDFETGPMMPTPMYFHFGNQTGGLTFHAYLTSMSIEYTHFSKNMIPMRVGMRISANMLPGVGASLAPDSSSGSGDWLGNIGDNFWNEIGGNDLVDNLGDWLGDIGERIWNQ